MTVMTTAETVETGEGGKPMNIECRISNVQMLAIWALAIPYSSVQYFFV